MDSNSEAASIPTYAVVDMTKKNSHAAKKKHQPEILSDIPMYSEVNRESESTGPWSESTAFDNQMYSGSMATIENVHSMLNKTAIKVAVEEPIALQENPSETNTKVKKISSSHSKKNQCDKTVACILVTITLLIFVIVVALTIAIAAFVLISQLNSELASIRKSTSLSNQEALALTNSSIQMIEMRFSQDLSMIESQTMALIQNYTERSGLYQNYPAASCGAILQFVPSSPSGHYWIRSSDGSAVHVYCDMTRSCGGVTGGWMRVAELDMRDSGSQCPSDLRMGTACNPTRTCMIDTNDAGCSSISFTAHNFNYSRVCGMIRAYQVGTPDAFGIFGTRPDPPTLDSNYVDGISLTYGTFPIQHIWTLAAEAVPLNSPCMRLPPEGHFFRNDPNFFCDGVSGLGRNTCENTRPLWNGGNCTNCASSDNPPWFYRQLQDHTTDDIEMRVCRDERAGNEDVAIEAFEFYIQ